MPLVLTAAAIGGVPLLALLLLVLVGAASPLPSLAAMVAIAAMAVLLAALLGRRIARLLDLVSGAHGHDSESGLGRRPSLLSLAAEVESLSRRARVQTAEIARLRQAEFAVLNQLPTPLLVLDQVGALLRTNVIAQAAFGGDIPAILRQPALRSTVSRALAGSGVHSAELTLSAPVVRELHASVVVLTPPLAGGGQLLILLSDRTRERAVERMRADFVANASHELRTPLASLIGFIETLRGPAANDAAAQARFLAIMDEQAARMKRLIDNLLNLSRIELSEHQAPQGEVELAELVPRVIAGFEPAFATRGQRLELSLEPALPSVLGDADQLAQVLQNLIDNAVRHGRHGGVIHLSAGTAESDPRWPAGRGIVVAVADDGPGIPRQHLPRLTERFYRVDRGRSSHAGTGLGLAIIKHIVNRHRGRLLIESTEGTGAIFSIWLPLV